MTNTIETNRNWEDHWSSIVRRVGKDDLMRQAERTICGVPMPSHHAESTVKSIIQYLHLGPDDILLDLCSGNGLITVRLARFCRLVVGVDFSLELIRVAQELHSLENVAYLHRAAEDLGADDFLLGKPTKVCMIAGLQYFTEGKLERLMQSIKVIARNKLSFYFGEVPDAGKIGAFYSTPERWAEFEKRRALRTEAIGTWWDRSHLISILENVGYSAQIVELESLRCTAHYRFDVLAHLER